MLQQTPIADDHERRSRFTPRQIAIAAAVVALLVVAAGIFTRMRSDRQLEQAASEAGIVPVEVIVPRRPSEPDALMLPGSVQALNSAAINARTNGYLRRWLVDIGDEVKPGQPLAVLDAPEVDQQLAAARADYQTALANQQLARSTAERWKTLLARDAVSRQEADEKAGDYAAKTAIAEAQRANVRRLEALRGFTELSAPFAGVVTSRTAQIGGLVTAGNASAQPLFTVADVRRMRVYVQVPQAFSGQLHRGLAATMTVPEYPGRTFNLVVARTSGAVDPQSGTVLTELETDNRDRALKPGAYAQVHFLLGTAGEAHFRVPATALIFSAQGPTLAIVGSDSRIRMRRVEIGRDEGKQVEIVDGLSGGERIVDNPPDALAAGDRVRVETARAAA